MGWFGLPRDTQRRVYIFALCPVAKTSLTAQSPSPVPQEAPMGVFQKFSPAAQAADSELYGSHNVVPAVARDNEARMWIQGGLFSKAGTASCLGQFTDLKITVLHEQAESSWASDLCSL